MHKINMLTAIMIVLILSSTMFAQVEKTVKETKVKIEKVEKKVTNTKDSMSSKKCGADCKMACCTAEAKEMKAEMKTHGEDCKCEACKTASAANNEGHKRLKKAHAADCDCEGCTVAHMEIKKQKAHGKDCSCEGCSKT